MSPALGSLRSRVTIASVAVVAPVLLLLVVVVSVAFTVAGNRSVSAILTDHTQLARQLAAEQTPAAEMITRLDTHSTRVRLVFPDGTVLGGLPDRAMTSGAQTKTIEFGRADGYLDGARLTLLVDGRLLDGARTELLWVLGLAAAAAVAVIAVGVPFAMKMALAPLDSMTNVARRIASGQRGKRIGGASVNTEIGRTGAAFDEMLDALEGAEKRALAAEEGMRRFVADAAHELRTPIAGIVAAAGAALQQSATENPEHQRLLLMLGGEARRAGRLVDDLLDVARLDTGLNLMRAPTDLRPLVAAEIDRLSLHRPDVHVELTGPTVVAAVDARRIGQVVANLLDNAAQAMPHGGRIGVWLAETAGWAQLTIADDGPGIDPSDRERVFDRLVRLHAAAAARPDGSGLGLPIARGIARAHGGEVTCIDPPAGFRGACLEIRLPLS